MCTQHTIVLYCLRETTYCMCTQVLYMFLQKLREAEFLHNLYFGY